jgi:hypothetical protein
MNLHPSVTCFLLANICFLVTLLRFVKQNQSRAGKPPIVTKILSDFAYISLITVMKLGLKRPP